MSVASGPDHFVLCPLLQADLGSDANFDHIMALQGEIFRALDGRKTIRFERNDRGYFAKLHTGVGWKEIFKNLLQLRMPVIGAQHERLAIQRLGELHIDTLKLAGYGLRGRNPARLQSFIITEELSGTISLEDFCCDWRSASPDPALRRALIKKVADIARQLHEHGVNHRDFYLCHFLLENLTQPAPDNLHIYLIDLHRAQLRPRTPQRWVIKDLAGLYFSALDIGLTRRDLLLFMKVYQGLPLKNILCDKRAFWAKVEERALRLYRKPLKS